MFFCIFRLYIIDGEIIVVSVIIIHGNLITTTLISDLLLVLHLMSTFSQLCCVFCGDIGSLKLYWRNICGILPDLLQPLRGAFILILCLLVYQFSMSRCSSHVLFLYVTHCVCPLFHWLVIFMIMQQWMKLEHHYFREY